MLWFELIRPVTLKIGFSSVSGQERIGGLCMSPLIVNDLSMSICGVPHNSVECHVVTLSIMMMSSVCEFKMAVLSVAHGVFKVAPHDAKSEPCPARYTFLQSENTYVCIYRYSF